MRKTTYPGRKAFKGLILSCVDSSGYSVDLDNATDSQKRIIIDMVSDRQLNGNPIDANILVRLGKLAGVDFLDIEPLDYKE